MESGKCKTTQLKLSLLADATEMHTHIDSVRVRKRRRGRATQVEKHSLTFIRLHTQVSLVTNLKLQRKVNCILMLPTPQQQEQQQREQHQQQHQQLNQLQQQQQPQRICSTSCAHTMKQYSIIYCNNGLRLRVPDIPARANSCSLPHSHQLSLYPYHCCCQLSCLMKSKASFYTQP